MSGAECVVPHRRAARVSDAQIFREGDHHSRMALNGPTMLGAQCPRCARCGNVIGVYEALIHVHEATVRCTSRAAEPQIVSVPGIIYHEDCYGPEAALRMR